MRESRMYAVLGWLIIVATGAAMVWCCHLAVVETKLAARIVYIGCVLVAFINVLLIGGALRDYYKGDWRW